MNKQILMFGISVLLILSIANLASAELWACFTMGQIINYCNPQVPDSTCGADTCKRCMASYNEALNCYSGGSLPQCNGLSGEAANCNTGNGSGGSQIDVQAPSLIFNNPNPDNSSLFTNPSIKLNYTLNEVADVYTLDDRGRTSRICNDCNGLNVKTMRFEEGLSELVLIAEDVVGNTANFSVSFFVDSKKPKINKAEPKSGYAGDEFYVDFTEENPVELLLKFGNTISGFDEMELDSDEIDNLCNPVGSKQSCTIPMDLSDYDGEEIQYWYNLTDIADNWAASKVNTVDVDITEPVMTLPLNYTIDGTKVIFNFTVIEQNFDEVNYIDNDASRPTWRTLCTSLKNGACFARKTFAVGQHSVDLQAIDEAGNSAAQNIQFEIV